MKMPADESILVLFDDTVFGSAKEGLLIEVTGLYYNPGLNYSAFASWEKFLANPIKKGRKRIPFWRKGELKVIGRSWFFDYTIEQVYTFLIMLRAKALDGR